MRAIPPLYLHHRRGNLPYQLSLAKWHLTSLDVAAGQAGASLHTMAVLQVYRAYLLKDLDHGEVLGPEAVKEPQSHRLN